MYSIHNFSTKKGDLTNKNLEKGQMILAVGVGVKIFYIFN